MPPVEDPTSGSQVRPPPGPKPASHSATQRTQLADFTEIPIVDFALYSTDRPRFLSDLNHALHNVGFMYLKNAPGFDADTQQRLFDLAHAFFEDLPEETRMRYHEEKHFHGFLPPKTSQLLQWFHYSYGKGPVDQTDASIPEIHRILEGANQWPQEASVKEFKDLFEQHLRNCDALNKTLQHAVAEMLGLPEDTFDKYFWTSEGDGRKGFASVRIIHFTPYEEAEEEREFALCYKPWAAKYEPARAAFCDLCGAFPTERCLDRTGFTARPHGKRLRAVGLRLAPKGSK